LSCYPENQQGRALAISEHLGHVAIGVNDGRVLIRKSIKELDEQLFVLNQPKEWIEAIRYSPDSSHLAVGSHDNVVYVYETKGYTLVSKCAKHNSYICSLDWSMDGTFLQSTCGAYELLFHFSESGK
jgi:WD40 repeat protein